MTPHDSSPSEQSPPPPILPYASGVLQGKLVTLRRLPRLEAELAKAKLESEGIRCVVLDQNVSVAHPLLFTDVPLQVFEDDLEQALEILDRPAVDDDGEYVEEDWRCPQCHRKTLDLMPLSSGWRRVRRVCWTLWAAPLIVIIARWVFDSTSIAQRIDEFAQRTRLPWLVVTAVVTVVIANVKRDKRCRECGFVWRNVGKASQP